MRAAYPIAVSLCAALVWSGAPTMAQQVRWPELLQYRTTGLDLEFVRVDDELRAERGELELYARTLDLSLRSWQHGHWTTEGAERVSRIRVSSPGAQAMELLLEDVVVPAGASLSMRGLDGRELAGPIPLELPNGVQEYAAPMVFADDAVVEYREPLAAAFQGRFTINGLAHAYRSMEAMEREGPCHVNVTCSPEADGWQDVIKATVRISVVTPEGNGWCSGTLVNNVRQDCTPYILSAYHCGRTSTAAQFNQYKFYFNFQYASCTGGAYSTSQYLTGAQRVAYSDDYAPQYQGLGGSDFMLLRTNVQVPAQFQPYWAGWDAANTASVAADGVCIHHPTGAPKRISTYTQTLTTGHPLASSGLLSHYKAKWAATQNGHGVTEQGSSGAGLFKPHAEHGPVLIGTLTGSSSGMSCTNNSGTAYFGKMSYHWTNNPNAAALKLKYWLDPDATGTLALAGSAAPCGAAVVLPEVSAHVPMAVHPNPADGKFHIVLPTAFNDRTDLSVMDVSGRLVATETLARTREAVVDLSLLPTGLYTVVAQDDVHRATARISIQH